VALRDINVQARILGTSVSSTFLPLDAPSWILPTSRPLPSPRPPLWFCGLCLF
jgi:hypothetical protein